MTSPSPSAPTPTWSTTAPEIRLTSAAPTGLNGLADSKDVKAMQDALNAAADASVQKATLWKATPGDLLQDAQEALLGITSDLLGQSERKSLRDIFGHGNRLRGLGVAIVVLVILGTLIDWLLGSGSQAVVVSGD